MCIGTKNKVIKSAMKTYDDFDFNYIISNEAVTTDLHVLQLHHALLCISGCILSSLHPCCNLQFFPFLLIYIPSLTLQYVSSLSPSSHVRTCSHFLLLFLQDLWKALQLFLSVPEPANSTELYNYHYSNGSSQLSPRFFIAVAGPASLSFLLYPLTTFSPLNYFL